MLQSILQSTNELDYINHKLLLEMTLSTEIGEYEIEGRSLMYHAIKSRNPWSMQLLLDLGIDVNGKDYSGFTPLHYAVILNDFNAVQFLLSRNADISSADFNGDNLLHTAVKVHFRNTTKVQGSFVFIPLEIEDVPLCENYAVERNLEIILFLISRGIDKNARNKDGSTALHTAVIYDSLIDELLQLGFDTEAIDFYCDTPFNVAILLDRTDAATKLVTHQLSNM
jgi:serine/threonine-protein phosphatase 6 regulatory ankyrin repeat subunit B